MSAMHEERPLNEWTKAHRDAFLQKLLDLVLRRLQVTSLEDVFADGESGRPRSPSVT